VPDALPRHQLLEPRLTTPRHELPAIVAEDLSRCAPLADGTLDHLQHRVGCLLPEQPVAHQVPRVVVDDAHQVHRVHPLQLKGEDVDLPQRVRQSPLEPSHRRWLLLRLWRWIAEPRFVDHAAHRLRAHLKTFVTPQVIADTPNTMLGVLLPVKDDPRFELAAQMTR
jgi:hypothetical protein